MHYRRLLPYYLCALTLLVLSTTTVFAHGGVAQNVGNVTVFLKQDPLSPLVGETVTMYLALSGKDDNQPLKKTDVQLHLIDTVTDDESKHKTLLEQTITTDENGNLTFSHTFDKENFFDVELTFKDPITHEEETTGFLVQPRAVPTSSQHNRIFIIVAAVVGFIIGQMFAKRKAR